MKKNLKYLALGAIPFASLFLLTSCGSKTYKVEFVSGEDDHFEKYYLYLNVNEGDHLSMPEALDCTFEDSKFGGWFNSSNGKLWDFENDVVTSDLKLRPKLERIKCNVIIPFEEDMVLNYGETVTLPTRFMVDSNQDHVLDESDYYMYKGYFNPKTNDFYDFGERITVFDDMTLELAPYNCSITYDLNGGVLEGYPDLFTLSGFSIGESIYLPNPKKGIDRFAGFKNSDGEIFEGSYTIKKENETLTAVYKDDVPFNYSVYSVNEYDHDLCRFFKVDYAIITEYKGGTDAFVPEYIDGCKVKRIASGAFKEAKELRKLIVSPGVKIDDGALEGISKLETLKLGGTTMNFDILKAFGVDEVSKLPENFKDIIISSFDGYYGSYQSSFLREAGTNFNVSLDKSIYELPENAFLGCHGIETLDLSNIRGEVSCRACHNCTRLKSVRLGKGINAIADSAFSSCPELETVINFPILDSVGISAFSGCHKLSLDEITAKRIERHAFDGCEKLKAPLDSVEYIGDFAFTGCNFERLRLENIESIGEYAFRENHNLVALSLSNVKSIGAYAFIDCENLVLIDIQGGLESVGIFAFLIYSDEYTAPIREVYADFDDWCKIKFGNVCSNPCYYGWNATLSGKRFVDDIDLYIPKNIETIGSCCFYGLKINNLIISDGVKYIGSSAFKGSVINTVVLSNSVAVSEYAFGSYSDTIQNLCLPYENDFVYNDLLANANYKYENLYYYSSNNVNETRTGNWWYFEFNPVTKKNKVVLITI